MARTRNFKSRPQTKLMLETSIAIESERSYLVGLNEAQQKATLITEGPLMVIAGAGSGKTRVLTARIAHLIEGLKVFPQNILAITFTNKAAKEMGKRVQAFLASSDVLGTPEIGTFHAFFLKILRQEMPKTPFSRPFVIYDEADQLSLITTVVKNLNIDTEDKAFNPKNFQNSINSLKCDAIEPHQYLPEPDDSFGNLLRRVYYDYQVALFANNALDFGEILCMAYRILRDHIDVRTKYQNIYKYIHVDEYQDTNHAQYLLLNILTKKEFGGHENICVVGDADQCIFEWRGANINNILDFEKDYPEVQTVKLEQNYRSTKNIVEAAGAVIQNNLLRKDKTMWTHSAPGNLISYSRQSDERTEAELVVRELQKLIKDKKCTYSDCAILYRNNAQSRQFEDVLLRCKIPYQVVGGTRFYDRKEIKDIMSYFRVISNPTDSTGFKRIINRPARGIGDVTLKKVDELHLQMVVENSSATYWEALRRAATTGVLSSALTKNLMKFIVLMEQLIADGPQLLLSELYRLVISETKYLEAIEKEAGDEVDRARNLEEFSLLLEDFEASQLKIPGVSHANLLPQFLDQAALLQAESKDTEQSVKLMTCHSSKGLEFKTVFLVGLEEGLFPSTRTRRFMEDDDNVEEERRLCYVGMTRAQEYLYLTFAAGRVIWGRWESRQPARFLGEIPKRLMISV